MKNYKEKYALQIQLLMILFRDVMSKLTLSEYNSNINSFEILLKMKKDIYFEIMRVTLKNKDYHENN